MSFIDDNQDNKQREIHGELAELRRRIAELEGTKKQLEQQVSSSASVAEIAPPVTTAEELAQTLQTFVRRVAMILQAEKCVIMLYDQESGELVAQSPALKMTDEEIAAFRVKIDQGISGEVFRDGKPVICHDCEQDERTIPSMVNITGARDSLTVPMLIERRNENQQVVERNVIGVIHVFNKRYGLTFTDEDIRLLTVLGRNAASVISSARAFQAITAEKKQLEYTLQSMTAGLLVLTRNQRISLLNAASAAIININPVTSIGKLFYEVIENIELRDFLAKSLEEAGETALEFSVEDRFFQAETAKVRDDKQNVMGLLCVLNDVTELRNVERLKSDFVSTVSHELRTPLTAIKGFIRTLLDDPTGEFYDQEIRMEFYGIIDTECDRLVRLISDLLNVSRLERGLALHLNYASVDIAALVEKCISFQRSYTTKHKLVIDIPDSLPQIPADQDKLDQIITNLISNAIKYSPNGGTITTSVIDEGDKLRFAISDEGLGIPTDHMDKLFQRFHRVHSGDSQRVSGTGIGLFLVKNLVQAHKGAIWVESEMGHGSTFYFTLPKVQPPEQNN